MRRKARQASDLSSTELSAKPILDEIDDYVDRSMAVAKYISDFVNSDRCKQKDIATKLEKHESEISKWLSGFHNLTMKSIIKLETACSIKLLNPEIFSKPNTSIEGMYISPSETVPNMPDFPNNLNVWVKDLGDLSPASSPVTSKS